MSRQDVLALLREQEGAFVSGEEISHRLGLSRAAIWKAVDALRREGYTVEARTGRGYRLLDAPDVLTEPEIRRFLGETARVGRTLVCLAEVDSTNLRARQLAAEGAADGTVVVADRQTAGRGRLGRSFQSPGGQGIYLTALLRPDLPPERLSPVTAMAGVAVCRAVERLCGVSPGLKWPNDPVLDGKKLCGILTELSLEGETARVQELVLGIGINVLPAAGGFHARGAGDRHLPGPGPGPRCVQARPGGGDHPGGGPPLRSPGGRRDWSLSGRVPAAVRESGPDRAAAAPGRRRRDGGGIGHR